MRASFSIEINHINRSIGLHDAYPYVISKNVEKNELCRFTCGQNIEGLRAHTALI